MFFQNHYVCHGLKLIYLWFKCFQISLFFCGLHKVCSHIMGQADLFIYGWLALSTRVKPPSRGLVLYAITQPHSRTPYFS